MKKNPFTKKIKSMEDLKNMRPNKLQRVPDAPGAEKPVPFNLHRQKEGEFK